MTKESNIHTREMRNNCIRQFIISNLEFSNYIDGMEDGILSPQWNINASASACFNDGRQDFKGMKCLHGIIWLKLDPKQDRLHPHRKLTADLTGSVDYKPDKVRPSCGYGHEGLFHVDQEAGKKPDS
jgi:hypothetical protein